MIPFLIPKPNLRRIACALAGTAVMVFAAPAVAGACTVSTGGSHVFSKFSDLSDYVLTPGGTFNAGAHGWTLSNAAVAATGAGLLAGDSHSLRIGAGGSAISPAFCIGTSTPTVRFMVRESGALVGAMNASLVWTDWSGQSHTTYIGWVGGTSTWAPTVPLLVNALPLWESGTTLTVRLQLSPASGTWYVDDLFEDPYSRG